MERKNRDCLVCSVVAKHKYIFLSMGQPFDFQKFEQSCTNRSAFLRCSAMKNLTGISELFKMSRSRARFTDRMRERVGMKVVRAVKRNDDGVTHAAIDMLGALMQVRRKKHSPCDAKG